MFWNGTCRLLGIGRDRLVLPAVYSLLLYELQSQREERIDGMFVEHLTVVSK